MMLVAQRARELLLVDARAASDTAAALANAHRLTPVMGRTLLQDALPTSFGLKAAGWMAAIDQACAALAAIPLAVQMGGPVGHRDPAVAAAVARRLGLAAPAAALAHRPRAPGRARRRARAPRGSAREDRPRRHAVADSARGRRGPRRLVVDPRASATPSPPCPRWRAPSARPVSSRRCSPRWRHEHERAAGAWQAEWGTLTDLLRLTGSAVGMGARPARAPRGRRRRDARGRRADAGPRRIVAADRPRARRARTMIRRL